MTMSPAFDKELMLEQEKLAQVSEQIDKNLVEVDERRRKVWEYATSQEVAQNISRMLNNEHDGLTKISNSPYFARIDFEKMSSSEKYYIGRHTVFNGSDVLVLDWRAPVSSLYYDGRLGPASYNCPDGTIEGVITLKRQFNIKDRVLISYADMDICSNDEILQTSLSETSDVRLKNIIATIQAEQNAVIRRDIKKTIIVQGVAGSGKTTVALHRIAYLIYTYAKQLTPENILIIAPNRFFLDYISDTLPDLGVENIQQETYEDFAIGIVNDKMSVVPYNEELKRVVSGEASKDEQAVMKFKTSMSFADIVEKYLEDLETMICDGVEDFIIGNCIIVKKETIVNMIKQYSDRMSMTERIQRVRTFLLKIIKDIVEAYDAGYWKDIWHLTTSECDIVKKEGKKIIAKYLQYFKLKDAVAQLKMLISKKEYFSESLTAVQYKILKDIFVRVNKQKQISFEDMPAVLYINHKLFGTKLSHELKHIVIDEAQDLGEFHFYALRNMFKDASMTILGDIAQGIYSYRGIENWENLNERVFFEKAEIIPLVQSYRTSVEVMDEANKIASQMASELGISLAKSLLRHGEKVNYIETSSEVNEKELILKRVMELRQSKMRNIAVITKTDEDSRNMYTYLSTYFEDVNLIEDSTKKYLPGITVLPVYLAKGLEFDSVLLSNVNEENYPQDILDAKLLYVGITRAMHTLDIYYQKSLSRWLKV